MRALFIGLGSIGSRHLRLLRELEPGLEAVAWRSGRGEGGRELSRRLGVAEHATLEAALAARPDFAIVANPTHLHVDTALALARAGVPFLLEKPVSHSTEGLDELAQTVAERGLAVLVGFQLRHHPSLALARAWLDAGEVGRPLALMAEVGQWLPDWRPDRDYRQVFSAKAAQGGGVIHELTHELDLALAVMGPARRVACLAARVSALEIDTEDLAEISLAHASGGVSHVHLDCVQRSYARRLKLVGESGTVVWDYAEGVLELWGPAGLRQRITDPPRFHRDEMFRAQLRHWLEVVDGRAAPAVGLEQGIAVTRAAVAAHEAARLGKVVEL